MIFFKQVDTFIQQGYINLIKSNSKDFVTKYFYLKKECSFEISVHQRILTL